MDTGPEIEGHHHAHTGRPLLDLILGVSAIVISLISLGLAIAHGNAMERLVEANSWPFVATSFSNAEADGTPHFRLGIMNKGVGPARIDSLQVFYEGKPVHDARELVTRMSGGSPQPPIQILSSDVLNSVMSARETVNFVDVPIGGATPGQQKQLGRAGPKITFATCYCSVFDECWTVDTREAAPRPHKIKICPDATGTF